MTKLIVSFVLFLTITVYSQNFWQPLNGPSGGLVAEFGISPSTGNLFASTFGTGIMRSTDNGNSWIQTVNGFPSPLFDNGTVTIAFNQAGHIFASSFTKGLFRSTNNGDSWEHTGLTSGIIEAVIVTQNGSIFAASAGNYNIKRSTDNGTSWITLTGGLPSQVTIRSFAMDQNGVIYAGGSNFSTALYKTTNNGDNWQASSLSNYSVNSLAVNTSGHIFAGGFNGISRSTNSGDNWTAVNSGLTSLRVNHVYCSSTGQIFVCTDSSLYRSTNNGSNWVNIGFTNKHVNRFISLSNGSYLSSVYNEGIYKSTNSGTSWQQSNTGINGNSIRAAAFNQSGHIIACTENNGLQKTTDNGVTWQKLSNGLKGKNYYAAIYHSLTNILSSSDSGIFRSTDSGNNWSQVLGERFFDFTVSPNGNIFGSGVYPLFALWVSTNGGANWNIANFDFVPAVLAVNQSGHLFGGTSGMGVYKSTNNGLNWIQYGPAGSVRSITVSSNGYIYASIENANPGPEGLYRSTNAGLNWQHMGFNYTMYSLKTNSAGHIYGGTFGGGVYRSTNNGSSWDSVLTGMYNQLVLCLSFNQSGYLYAGTYYGGLYRTTLSTIGISAISTEIPDQYKLYQNYPNPFNPVTNINFAVPKNIWVTLKVYDILGREAAVLINENMTAGSYTVDYNASALPSGVYFYKITSGDFTDTRKMMLIK
jgi:photosystem II stability/assembly factor-like uncharacterized protein